MPFVNNGIYRVKALNSYIAFNNNYISFYEGQEFFALGQDTTEGYYLVSTEHGTPFSRTAVCGYVPIYYFTQVSLKNKNGILYHDPMRRILEIERVDKSVQTDKQTMFKRKNVWSWKNN